MYAIGTLPLIHRLQGPVAQVWYADDASAGGCATGLRRWWDVLQSSGPLFGYYPNPRKTCLIVKSEHLRNAEAQFQGTGMQITTQGQRHLGAPLGSKSFVEKFVHAKVSVWVSEIKSLSEIASSQPQAAYAALTHGLMSRWIHLMRTVPGIDNLFQPLDDEIRHRFLPALTGREAPSDAERELIALPARHGGLGIPIPTRIASWQFTRSVEITAPLVGLIAQQSPPYSAMAQARQKGAKAAVRSLNISNTTKDADALKPRLSKVKQMAMEQASETGTSSWLTTIPMLRYGYNLNKQAFTDALCLRFGWTPTRLPQHCSCGHPFSVDHALSCPKGAMPSIRENSIRDITAELLTEVCPNVGIEPTLQPLNGEAFNRRTANTEDNARLDIKAQNNSR